MWFLSDTCPDFSYIQQPRGIHEILENMAGADDASLSYYFAIQHNDPKSAQRLLADVLMRNLSEFGQFSKLGHPQWMDIKELGGQKAVQMAEAWLKTRQAYEIEKAEALFADLGSLLAECAHYALAEEGMQSQSVNERTLLQHKINALLENRPTGFAPKPRYASSHF